MGEQSYLIRYGVMSHVGRFTASAVDDPVLTRGQLVVLETDRGVELGEVLIALDDPSARPRDELGATASRASVDDSPPSAAASSPRVLHVASPDDLARSRWAAETRGGRFSLCQRILQEGNWPWEIVDVEPLLDGRSTVIHYLGPHQIDVASLRARFRVECDLDVVLEPVGADLDGESSDDDARGEDNSAGCGSCGCADGGGCGPAPAPAGASHEHAATAGVGGCAIQSHSGCASCGIGRLLAERNQAST